MALPDACPLCRDSREHQNVVTPHVYGGGPEQAFFRCTSCDAIYMFPGLTPEEESRFYAAEFEGFMAGRAGTKGGWERADDHVAANEATRTRRMRYLEPRIPRNGRILEVGCSSGFMLYPLAASHECFGIEPSGVFREYVGRKNVTVFDSMSALQTAVGGTGFDVVMHFFVLEHIADPRAFLEEQLSLLRPGGRLIFEIPNASDPLYSVYDIPAFERFYWSVAHHWYFTEKSLRFLLDSLGVRHDILYDQRYDLSNHMTWARDGRPGGMGRFTAKLGAELEEGYKQALIKSGYCDTLVGVLFKA